MKLKETGTNFFLFILRRSFKYLSPIIHLFEKKPIKKYSSKQPEFPIVFIIGAPRSGSTILYQLITNFFDVSYINNLIYLSRENLFFGFWLNRLVFKNKKHDNFQSNYGNTKKFGLNAPSEGGQIWYKWFSKDQIYFEKGSLSDKKIIQIRKLFYAIINKQQKPIIIKNLMTSQRLLPFSEIFPSAKFIFIKRLPEYNAQSIYKARKKLSPHEWWSVKPKNYQDLLNLSLAEQSVKQVYYIEKQIMEDINLFPKKNIKIVNYEDLISDYKNIFSDLKSFIGCEFKEETHATNLDSGNNLKIDKEEFEQIKNTCNRFDWKNYKILK
ncbi:MAG: sulfotransferase [Bacteroidota bacterium]